MRYLLTAACGAVVSGGTPLAYRLPIQRFGSCRSTVLPEEGLNLCVVSHRVLRFVSTTASEDRSMV